MARAEIAHKGTAKVIVELQTPRPAARGLFSRAEVTQIQASAVKSLEGSGVKVYRRLATVPYVYAQVDGAGLERLAASSAVRSIGADIAVTGALAESAVAIGAKQVVDRYGAVGWDGRGAVVGLIDSGIDLTHPDLADALVTGVRFLDQATTPTTDVQDDNGHGTMLAGVITSDGLVAPRGIAPASRLVVIKVLDSQGMGYISDVVSGLDWIVEHHAEFPALKFVNFSVVFLLHFRQHAMRRSAKLRRHLQALYRCPDPGSCRRYPRHRSGG